MTRLRYRKTSLLADAARGGVGLGLTLAPSIFVEAVLQPIEIILWGLSVIFMAYLGRTLLRYHTEIQLSHEDILRITPFESRRLSWNQINEIRLSYFSSARARSGEGILTLRFTGETDQGKIIIIVESTLTGFDSVVEMAASLVGKSGVQIDDSSLCNFDALGFPVTGRMQD